MNRLGCVALALLVAGGCSSSASAAGARPDPVVARDGTARLTAADRNEELCLTLAGDGSTTGTCARPGETAALVLRTQRGSVVGFTTSAVAARVEVRRAGKLLGSGRTVVGAAYRGGRRGAVRFAVLRLPPDARADGLRIRSFDASGALVDVQAAGDRSEDLVAAERVALSGRSGRTRWSVQTSLRSFHAPSILDLDREGVARCVEFTVDGREDDDTLSGCSSEDPSSAIEELLGGRAATAQVQERCETRFRLLSGSLDGQVTQVRVVLGDGRKVTARTASYAATATTLYAAVIPDGAAVRAVRVEHAGGRSSVLPFSAPPLSVACVGGVRRDAFSSFFDPDLDIAALLETLPTVAPVGGVTTLAGPPALRVADGPAQTLCLGLDSTRFTGLSCSVVPPDLSDPAGAVDDIRRPRAFALVVPSPVATVRITRKGGPPRALATVAGDGYTGPYAGRVRFVTATIADAEDLRRIELLDATGKVLSSSTNDNPVELPSAPRASVPRRLAGAPGRPSLWQTTLRSAGTTDRCVALTSGPPPTAAERCQGLGGAPFEAVVEVPCSTRRLVLAVVVDRGARVTLDTGGRPRAVRLRRGAAVVTLPPSVGVRAITVRRSGRPTLRVPVAAPPGARQCGWQASNFDRRQ